VRADPYLDDDGLRTFYSNYYQELYARAPDPAAYFEGQADYGRRVLKAIRQIAPCARTAIEIGCGAGGALSVLRDAGFATAGCDHSRELIAFGSARGIDHLVVGGLEDLAGAHRALREVDIVYLHHVFEHLSDPASFLRSCRAVLSNRGVLIAIVPDISRIHAFPFPAGDVRLFLHFAHKYNYSRLGLRMLGTRCGWEVAFLDGFASRNAPELWTVLKPADTPAGGDPAESGGDEMLTYLRQTEARYRFGLLSGYKVGPGGRMQRLAREVLPASVIRWIAAARRMATGSK